MTNIDIFNQYTAEILAELYDNHPIPMSFEMSPLVSGLVDNPKYADLQIEEIFDLHEQCYWTFDFLDREGYIDCAEINPHLKMISQAKLTLKGLNVLNSDPLGQNGKPLGHELLHAAKEGALDKVKELVGQALQPSNLVTVTELLAKISGAS